MLHAHPGRLSGGAIAAHWITFLSMFACTLFLGYSSWTAKGPSSKQRYFAGYNEVPSAPPPSPSISLPLPLSLSLSVGLHEPSSGARGEPRALTHTWACRSTTSRSTSTFSRPSPTLASASPTCRYSDLSLPLSHTHAHTHTHTHTHAHIHTHTHTYTSISYFGKCLADVQVHCNPPAFSVGSSRLLQVLDLCWRSPKSGEMWYTPRRCRKRRFDRPMRACGHETTVRCRVQGAGCRVQGVGCRVQGAGCWVRVAGCRVQGEEWGLQGAGCGERARQHAAECGPGVPNKVPTSPQRSIKPSLSIALIRHASHRIPVSARTGGFLRNMRS